MSRRSALTIASADAGARRLRAQLSRQLAAGLAAAPVAKPGAIPLAGAAQLARAQAEEAAGRPDSAARRYRQAIAVAPFNAALVLAAADFYARHQQPGNAYDVLQQGLSENPADLALLQAFALAAARAGVPELGQSALAQLKPQLAPAAYAALAARFDALRRAHAAAAAGFEGPDVGR